MLTVFILASRRDRRYVEDFWTHLAATRRTLSGVIFVEPCYIEDMVQAQALVPAQLAPYVVVGCCSGIFLAAIFEQSALREFIEGAAIKVPLIISACHWNERPSPFVGKWPVTQESVAEVGRRKDQILLEAVLGIRKILTSM